jgi:glycosyltransferase involved in cell wall biosynthesis
VAVAPGLVSCVMPTRNRRRSVSQAIWYFLRQDYEPRELIVVDDGEAPVGELVPRDPRIRYERLSGPVSLAAKRNHGCRVARGDLIAHWDDHAWYSPDRLSVQVRQLEGSGAAALRGVLHYQPLTGRVWRYDSAPGTLAGLHGATLAYRRSVWEKHPFDVDAPNELAAFMRAVPLAVGHGQQVAVVLLEGRGTGPVNPADTRWRPRPYDELARLLEQDRTLYRRAAAAPKPAPVTLAATFMVYDGYGSMAEYLALGMARAGADVHVEPFRIDPAGMSPEFRALWKRSRGDPDGIVLCHAWWGENLARFGSARDLFVKTAWESSRLPADWPDRLNEARAVLVPSRFTARVFRESGVSKPVEVIHEGVDPHVYPYFDRPRRRTLTTLVVGVLAPRKNFREAVAAWKLAFADDPDARLVLKARFQVDSYVPDDPRIEVVDVNEPTRGIAHWYERADILLALGNEGFGLPLVEGMATGLPAVALNAEAQSDVCSDAEGMLLPVPPKRWAPVDAAPFGPAGVRAIPDVEAAARRLRWAAEHRAEARAMGRRASRWAHRRRNVWDMGPAALEAIERHARTSRPLRRSCAVWAPEGGPASFRYYAQDLTRSSSTVRRHHDPPRAWRSQSLHVQHAPGLFDDEELARAIGAARAAGVGVAITEHEVGPTATAWEQRADVLVALDEAAARLLRERWPGKRVELIPPGCPAWRAASRERGGRTVATIGASADRLKSLEVLAEAGDIDELVHLRELPRDSDRLARQLNESADVVVVWPGGYLARIALASGVPVVVPRPVGGGELAEVTTTRDDPAEDVLEALETGPAAAAREFCEAASWPRVAAVHDALWRTVCS